MSVDEWVTYLALMFGDDVINGPALSSDVRDTVRHVEPGIPDALLDRVVNAWYVHRYGPLEDRQ